MDKMAVNKVGALRMFWGAGYNTETLLNIARYMLESIPQAARGYWTVESVAAWIAENPAAMGDALSPDEVLEALQAGLFKFWCQPMPAITEAVGAILADRLVASSGQRGIRDAFSDLIYNPFPHPHRSEPSA